MLCLKSKNLLYGYSLFRHVNFIIVPISRQLYLKFFLDCPYVTRTDTAFELVDTGGKMCFLVCLGIDVSILKQVFSIGMDSSSKSLNRCLSVGFKTLPIKQYRSISGEMFTEPPP